MAAKPTMANMMGMPASTSGGLEDYTRDLTELARDGRLEPVIGRDQEISRIVQILSRKTKNNPVLVGDAGVVRRSGFRSGPACGSWSGSG